MTMQQDTLTDDYVIDLRSTSTPYLVQSRDGLPRVPVLENESFYARYGKTILDRVGAAVLLIVASPILLVTGLLILLQLGRPILLTQQRIGLGGEPFDMLKFRTMHPDRRRRSIPWRGPERRSTHKTPEDPRHTPVGRVLRKLSLDELPQLINVIKGEMSLVGPRPELAPLVRTYEPWQHGRHAVRPGLTGLWQTTARDIGLMKEHVHLDLEYIRRLSLRTDLMLLFRTIGVLLRPKTH